MSDPKDIAALTRADVSRIVEGAGTHSLISASVLSAQVNAEASAYLLRCAAALETIQHAVQGQGGDGSAQPIRLVVSLDPAAIAAIGEALAAALTAKPPPPPPPGPGPFVVEEAHIVLRDRVAELEENIRVLVAQNAPRPADAPTRPSPGPSAAARRPTRP